MYKAKIFEWFYTHKEMEHLFSEFVSKKTRVATFVEEHILWKFLGWFLSYIVFSKTIGSYNTLVPSFTDVFLIVMLYSEMQCWCWLLSDW